MRRTTVVPLLALVVLGLAWHRSLPVIVTVLIGLVLIFAVLAAVYHAEVIAHRLGEPYGSLVLALAVTTIEVALIVSVMLSSPEKGSTLARDTAFSAVMIACNGIVGLCLLVTALRHRTAIFHREGTGAMLATIATLVTLTMVIPDFTTSSPGPYFTRPQLAFAAVASLGLWALFVLTQTVRHRGFFLPVTEDGGVMDDDSQADPPSNRTTLASLALMLTALIAVVGLAKTLSPSIESGLASASLPPATLGVVISLLVLLPETLAAVRAARADRTQTSLNLALGSTAACIGLTIPAIAVASIWMKDPLELGLTPMQLVLFVLTVIVSTLTIVPGRATILQAGVHLSIFAAFLFLTLSP